MISAYRYAAFISYSSKDSAFAVRLHRALESYRIPRALGSFQVVGGGKPNRVYPVFRDRDELSAGELDGALTSALEASSALIVVCSPASAQSAWVAKEIEFYSKLGRRERIFAVIAGDLPLESEGKDATLSFLPSLLAYDPVARTPVSVVAADARPSKDGFRRAVLKCVAGVASIPLAKLIDRDRAARRRRRALTASVLCLIALLLATLVVRIRQQAQLSSRTLAGLAATAAREGDSDAATRLALAGMTGFDRPIIGFDPSEAEAQLVQTVAQTHAVPGSSAAFTRGGREIVSTAGVEILTTNLLTGSVRRRYGPHPEGEAKILYLSPDEKTLVTRGDDGTCAYDLARDSVLSCEIAGSDVAGPGPGGRHVLAAGSTPTPPRSGIYDLTNRDWVVSTAAEVKAISPDGKTAAITPGPSRLVLVDLADGDTSRVIDPATNSDLGFVLFSPDGRRLAAGGRDASGETETGSYGAWDVASPRSSGPSGAHGSPFLQTHRWGPMQFSPDGALLAISAGDTILLIDAGTGARVKSLSGDFEAASQVAFSPDGRRLAFGAGDRTIRLWDVVRAAEIGRFRGPAGPTVRLAFDPTGRRLVTVAEVTNGLRGDEDIRVWSIDFALHLRGRALMARACATTLAGDSARIFTAKDLARAPMLDRASPADACAPPSLPRMLWHALGF